MHCISVEAFFEVAKRAEEGGGWRTLRRRRRAGAFSCGDLLTAGGCRWVWDAWGGARGIGALEVVARRGGRSVLERRYAFAKLRALRLMLSSDSHMSNVPEKFRPLDGGDACAVVACLHVDAMRWSARALSIRTELRRAAALKLCQRSLGNMFDRGGISAATGR